MPRSATISPQKLASKKEAGHPVDLVDVRTPAEFEELRPTFARNIPLHTVKKRLLEGLPSERSSGPVYLICRTGSRAARASRALLSAGIEDVVLVKGGTEAWLADGLPVIRGKKAISIDRQVRIAAGALVVTGAALAIFVHPLFAAVAAFVGTGLVFAGITDTCGLAMVIARLPWNQKCGASQCQE